jgi:hypothetical protein
MRVPQSKTNGQTSMSFTLVMFAMMRVETKREEMMGSIV